MGILGLQGYMDRQEVTEKVNIKTLADNFRRSQRITPILILDGSVFNNIYDFANTDKLCGGQMKEYVYMFDKLLRRLSDCGIRCIMISDAYPPDHRLGIWKDRRIREVKSAGGIMFGIETKQDVADLQKNCLFPSGASFSAYNYLRCVNAEHIQTTREADDEIIYYLNNNKCFGVLGQDSDFVIAQGVFHYLSIKDLDISTMDTVEYRRDYLARKLSLRPDLLPIFATLAGNDVIPAPQLRAFHLHLLRNERNYQRYASSTDVYSLPKFFLFPRIAEWINDQSISVNLMRNPEKLARMVGLPALSEKFTASVQSYFPSQDNTAPVRTGDANWDRIVKTCCEKMRNGHQYSRINSVITSQVVFSSIFLQYFNRADYPPDGVVCRTIRRKFFGILLKEHPQSASIQVKEYTLNDPGSDWPQLARPIFPDRHPGLLSMWLDPGNLEEKWQLLCWTVGEGVPLKSIRALPEPLQIPTLAIFYITHEIKNLLQTWQASALALQAVCLLRATPLSLHQLQCKCEDAVAVHFAAVYQQVCKWVTYAADACGNPTCLFNLKDAVVFDGKLFHLVYLSFKRRGNFNEFLNSLTTEEVKWFKLMQGVIGNY